MLRYLTILILSGCSSFAPYISPLEGPRSKMRVVFADPTNYVLVLYAADRSTCKATDSFPDLGIKKVDHERVGMLGEQPFGNNNFERIIKAGEPISLTFNPLVNVGAADVLFPAASQQDRSDRSPSICPLVTFSPLLDAQYEVVVDVGPGKCDVSVYQLSPSAASAPLRTEVDVERNPTLCAPFQLYKRK